MKNERRFAMENGEEREEGTILSLGVEAPCSRLTVKIKGHRGSRIYGYRGSGHRTSVIVAPAIGKRTGSLFNRDLVAVARA